MEKAIESVCSAIRNIYIDKHTAHEVEARLGKYVSGRFVPGVDSDWFDAMVMRFEHSESWKEVSHWYEMEDTNFMMGSTKLRQSRICDPVTCDVQLITIEKIPISSSVIGISCTDTNGGIESGADSIRIAYSKEKEVSGSKNNLPMTVDPIHVRLKQRKYFIMNSDSVPGSQWKFEFSRIWSGSNREEAEMSQNNTPVCEIEIEWIPPQKISSRIPCQEQLNSISTHVTNLLVEKITSILK